MKKTKVLLSLACVVMLVAASVMGTMAYLTSKPDTVTNTFTIGKVEITLDEAKVNADGKPVKSVNGQDTVVNLADADRVTSNSYNLIPGYAYTKDPTVTVKGGSVDCLLFVKFEEKDSADYLTYTSNLTAANGWTQGEGTGTGKNGVPTNVWFRTVNSSTADQSFKLLDGDKITVKDTVTGIAQGDTVKLEYTAYAIQLKKDNANNFAAAAAWAELNPTT